MASDFISHKCSECPVCKTSFGDYMIPSDDLGREALKDYKLNMPLRNRVTAVRGSEKQRSLIQLNLYWASCSFVANNVNDAEPKFKNWKTKEAVDFKLRVALDFRDPNIVAVKPDGQVIFKYRSIAIANLKHILACRYFDQAFELMAHIIGYKTTDDFIKAVKSNMIGGY